MRSRGVSERMAVPLVDNQTPGRDSGRCSPGEHHGGRQPGDGTDERSAGAGVARRSWTSSSATRRRSFRVRDQLSRLSESEATVLIAGETGTGKELTARALHYLSSRAGFPFVAVNCAALPDTLLEDELFGHERGAFTDAHAHASRASSRRPTTAPSFSTKSRCLTPRAQGALLRVLHDRTFRVLGSSIERSVDVRFVAATNVDLAELVQRGAFRADLFYRLRVLWLELPPLRESARATFRCSSRHFLAKHALRGRPGAGSEPRPPAGRWSTSPGQATSGSSRTRSSARCISRTMGSSSRSISACRLRSPGGVIRSTAFGDGAPLAQGIEAAARRRLRTGVPGTPHRRVRRQRHESRAVRAEGSARARQAAQETRSQRERLRPGDLTRVVCVHPGVGCWNPRCLGAPPRSDSAAVSLVECVRAGVATTPRAFAPHATSRLDDLPRKSGAVSRMPAWTQSCSDDLPIPDTVARGVG